MLCQVTVSRNSGGTGLGSSKHMTAISSSRVTRARWWDLPLSKVVSVV
jgi:hypothetical protein